METLYEKTCCWMFNKMCLRVDFFPFAFTRKLLLVQFLSFVLHSFSKRIYNFFYNVLFVNFTPKHRHELVMYQLNTKACKMSANTVCTFLLCHTPIIGYETFFKLFFHWTLSSIQWNGWVLQKFQLFLKNTKNLHLTYSPIFTYLHNFNVLQSQSENWRRLNQVSSWFEHSAEKSHYLFRKERTKY